MKKAFSSAAAVLLFAAGAFGQNLTDQQFVDKAGQINMTEAHMGKLAQQKGKDQSVKDYGQKLESDHTEAYQKLSAMSGFNVPKGIDAEHQKTIKRFDRLSGQQFDHQFKQLMIQDHQKAIDLYEKASNELTNQDLKTYASQQLVILRDHLARAKQLDVGGKNK